MPGDIHLMEIHLIITIGREVERQRERRNGKIPGRGWKFLFGVYEPIQGCGRTLPQGRTL